MTDNEPERNETIAQILDHHNADTVDELPDPVQNTIQHGPAATLDEGHPLATTRRHR